MGPPGEFVEDSSVPPDNGGVATGQHEGAPTDKKAAIDRIQAIRAKIRPGTEPVQQDPTRSDAEADPPTGDVAGEATPRDERRVNDARDTVDQRDTTIAALRAEIAILRQEVADIAARLAMLGPDDGEANVDD